MLLHNQLVTILKVLGVFRRPELVFSAKSNSIIYFFARM